MVGICAGKNILGYNQISVRQTSASHTSGMQTSPGQTLVGQSQPPTGLLPYVRHIADAIQYAHEHKVIHRDIKPENMLLNEQDEEELSDFGVAVLVLSSPVHDIQKVAGTTVYMAPEQITVHTEFASDQYALAVVLYVWLAFSRLLKSYVAHYVITLL